MTHHPASRGTPISGEALRSGARRGQDAQQQTHVGDPSGQRVGLRNLFADRTGCRGAQRSRRLPVVSPPGAPMATHANQRAPWENCSSVGGITALRN
jgi:hypothetical protein